jgi:hypothetical protein
VTSVKKIKFDAKNKNFHSFFSPFYIDYRNYWFLAKLERTHVRYGDVHVQLFVKEFQRFEI